MRDSSDIAREVADIKLLSDSLDELVQLRILSTTLMGCIKNNYSFIVAFNTGLLALGLTGLITPAASAMLHNTSTMMVAGMSMRPKLRRLPIGGGTA